MEFWGEISLEKEKIFAISKKKENEQFLSSFETASVFYEEAEGRAFIRSRMVNDGSGPSICNHGSPTLITLLHLLSTKGLQISTGRPHADLLLTREHGNSCLSLLDCQAQGHTDLMPLPAQQVQIRECLGSSADAELY